MDPPDCNSHSELRQCCDLRLLSGYPVPRGEQRIHELSEFLSGAGDRNPC